MPQFTSFQDAVKKQNQSKVKAISQEELQIVIDKARDKKTNNEITEEQFSNLCYTASLVIKAQKSSLSVEDVLADVLSLQNSSDYKAKCDTVKEGQKLINEIYNGLFTSYAEGSDKAKSAKQGYF